MIKFFPINIMAKSTSSNNKTSIKPRKTTLMPKTSSVDKDITRVPSNKTPTNTKKPHVKWENDVGGVDNLSSDARLLSFLLKDNGKNLNILTPTKVQKGKVRPNVSKRSLAQRCHEYFMDQKVNHRSVEDIRSRMKKWVQDYGKAGMLFKQTGNGSKGETSNTGSKEFEGS